MNYLDAARKYHLAGLKVIPFWKKNGGAVSFPSDYAQYRESQSTEDIETLFQRTADGIALLCTDGIEAIDIDVKHDPTKTIARQFFDSLKFDKIADKALDDCVIQRTKSNGWHVIYRTKEWQGNTKLAKRPGSKEAVLETRGKGGLLFIAPTPGYKVERGQIEDIQQIPIEARNKFLQFAKEFNCPEPESVEYKVKEKYTEKPEGVTPWDDYNNQHSVLDLLEHYGWKVVGQSGDYKRLNRLGAKHSRAVDATVIEGANLFYPFTTSTEFEPEKTYSPFAVYAVMEFGGDYTAAARAIYRDGFGDRSENIKQQPTTEEKKKEVLTLIEKARATKFDFNQPIAEEDTILNMYLNGKKYKVGGFGQMGAFVGHEKSGKSFLLSCVAASALAGGFEKANFQLDLKGKKMIWFDTEQSDYFYKMTQKRLYWIADQRDNVPFYEAYHLRRFSVDERLAIIEHIIYNTQNVGVVVVDGYVDLCKDYNNLEESQRLVSRFLKWSDERKFLLLGVLHLNKGDGKIRGHIGSEIKNKCDFIINVAKNVDEEYNVSIPTARYIAFPEFTFMRDDNGLPIMDDNF